MKQKNKGNKFLPQHICFNFSKTRFKIANITTPIFTATALKDLYNVSKAIPRRLNNLILNCLMLGYQNKKQLLDEEIVRNAKNELDL